MAEIMPIAKEFVAELTDVDIRQLSDEAFEEIYAAWIQYGVLGLRGQRIDEDELQTFSARFGPLEEIPFGRVSEAEKARAENRFVTQLSNIVVDGNLRPGFEPFDDPGEAPGATHPVVRTHEETGRTALFLGRREWAYVPGLPLEESERLLDKLWQHAALHEHVWRQQWRPWDLIIWDNRRVRLRRDDFDAESRRTMKRRQVLAR